MQRLSEVGEPTAAPMTDQRKDKASKRSSYLASSDQLLWEKENASSQPRLSLECRKRVAISTDSWPSCLPCSLLCYLLTNWVSWAGYWIFLYLGFLTCKMNLIVPASQALMNGTGESSKNVAMIIWKSHGPAFEQVLLIGSFVNLEKQQYGMASLICKMEFHPTLVGLPWRFDFIWHRVGIQ